MEHGFTILLTVLLLVYCAQGQEDCHRTATYNYYFGTWAHQCSHYITNGASAEWTGFSCGEDYDCCENACCKRTSETIPSNMETAGMVLSATAIFTFIILALLIFGSMFCSNKEDESKLFSKGRN
ncbi:hypothetical protein ACJMK2_019165 [Sinanodonta woodiana]|uniref:Uncharacterized protein n=1 Tax=Sinanodonta woodiana TaxID=1069815 RepID=A0ABD3UFM1_SINWO